MGTDAVVLRPYLRFALPTNQKPPFKDPETQAAAGHEQSFIVAAQFFMKPPFKGNNIVPVVRLAQVIQEFDAA